MGTEVERTLPQAPYIEVVLAVPADGGGLASIRDSVPVGDWCTLGIGMGRPEALAYGALALSAEVRNAPNPDCPISDDMAPTPGELTRAEVVRSAREVWDVLPPANRLSLVKAARAAIADAGFDTASETAWAIAVGIVWGAQTTVPPHIMAVAYVALGEGWES
jgi:hypothetical protein